MIPSAAHPPARRGDDSSARGGRTRDRARIIREDDRVTYPALPPLEIEKAFPNLKFERPLEITHAGDGTNRLFVVTQKGIIYVFPNRPDVTEDECKVFLDWTHEAQLVENETRLHAGDMGVFQNVT